MSIVLSLQGCMAVGKTTAVKYLSNHAPYVNISYEANSSVIQQVKARGLKKNLPDDYLEIQRLWISNEIERYKRAQQFDVTVMDFGAEEIEFYTLNYPKTISADWNIEEKLSAELRELRNCMPNRILFLDASQETLISRKEKDGSRTREFFDYYLNFLLSLKRSWFIGKKDVDILRIDNLSRMQVGEKVKKWVDSCIYQNR